MCVAMKTKQARRLGWLLLIIGVLVVVFREKIAFPGLEKLVGIEVMVGRENVIYEPDGSYLFTNPRAMIRWVLSVAAIGILICSSGVVLLFRTRRSERKM